MNNLAEFKQNLGCRCEDCKSLQRLTLKFIIHYGNLGSVIVKNCCKLFGLELIVAHRLLKNSIPHKEYILLSDAFMNHYTNHNGEGLVDMIDEAIPQRPIQKYDTVGKINFHYVELDSKRLHPVLSIEKRKGDS